MKGKPIRSGFKFFAICDSETKFVWKMLPYGRKSTKCGIIATVTNLVNSLPKFAQRGQRHYICAMDNYFTYHRVIENCVKSGVHVVGTVKVKRG